MRKLVFQMLVSVDGYVAGPNGEFDWHVVDDDFTDYIDRTLRSIDTILVGRVTYQGLAQYWPTATEPEAPLMNALPKVVFSRTLARTDWTNSRVATRDVADEVGALKEASGQDLALFGSPQLASTFVRLDLIDEYHLLVVPIILGAGKPLFAGLEQRTELTLTNTEAFRSGTVCHYYAPTERLATAGR